jgi:hypothetical protein
MDGLDDFGRHRISSETLIVIEFWTAWTAGRLLSLKRRGSLLEASSVSGTFRQLRRQESALAAVAENRRSKSRPSRPPPKIIRDGNDLAVFSELSKPSSSLAEPSIGLRAHSYRTFMYPHARFASRGAWTARLSRADKCRGGGVRKIRSSRRRQSASTGIGGGLCAIIANFDVRSVS